MNKRFKLELEKTDLTPYVLIDEEKRYMKLEGESYHENVISFFKEISDWLRAFLKTDFESFTFDCELTYFSSSTVKVLLNMLLDMDNSANSGKITVNWITNARNKIIIECGEDFKEDMKNIVFNLNIKEN
jgi:hypothetical protein